MEQAFKVEGMSCGHCVTSVKNELNKANITEFKVEIGKVILDTEMNNTTSEKVIQAIEDAGYKVVNINQLPVNRGNE